MSGICKSFNIENSQSRVCDSFTENKLGARLECGFKLLIRAVRLNKSEVNAHFLHRYGKEIICSAVNHGRSDNMIAAVCDIENCIE